MLKLPEGITALLFDLDGMITQTAKLHAAAWKEMFGPDIVVDDLSELIEL